MKLLIVIILFVISAASAADKPCVAIQPHPQSPSLPVVLRAWAQPGNFWNQRATLRVRFLAGTSRQKTEAWKRMQVIDSLVNLTFVQVTSGPSEIRVRFDRGKGHWSYLGRGCLTVPQSSQTMNLELVAGVFGDSSAEWDRVTLHETLHAIGFEHEHQSPLATSLVWNKEAVYSYYGQTQGWSRQEIDFQVLNRSTARSYVTTGFDLKSIMEYPIPNGLANVVVGWNDKLTASDVALAKRIYP